MSLKLSLIDFCAIDLETTGVNPAFDRIVEIGAVKFRLDGDSQSFQSLINPGIHIPDAVTRIHGITDSMVSGSPGLGDVMDEFLFFIKGTVFVIQNPRFDLSFIDRAFRSRGEAIADLHALDTVRLAKKYFIGLPNHKLSTLSRHLGLDLKSHRALDDALACMSVFRESLRGLGIGGNSTFGDLISSHGELVRPGIRSESCNGTQVWKKISIGEEVTIRYMDSDGRVTKRHILPKEFISYGKSNYILAHCYLRDDERCFITSRILGVD